jgi:hypothetical protein
MLKPQFGQLFTQIKHILSSLPILGDFQIRDDRLLDGTIIPPEGITMPPEYT